MSESAGSRSARRRAKASVRAPRAPSAASDSRASVRAPPLGPLDKPVAFLKGVGPRWSELLGRMGIHSARDLLYHTPRNYDDASTVTPAAFAAVGADVTILGTVRDTGVVPTRSGLKIAQAVVEDDSGAVTCSWPGQPWVLRQLKKGDRILARGPVKFFHGRQVQPREHAVLGRDERDGAGGRVFVVYPASEDVPQWFLRRTIARNLDWLVAQARQEEHLDSNARAELGLMPSAEALEALHRPRTLEDAAPDGPARRRLAFDELFFLQLLQARDRHDATRARPGIAFQRTGAYVRPLYQALPFELTGAQVRALRDVMADMTSPARMNRMLQGDVGSGKTVVALFAMLVAAEAGWQAALMAPTEILAEQHARSIASMIASLPLELAVMTGSVGGRKRDELRSRVASGGAQLVVGTHALVQEGVDFAKLGLVVVDEQHRFGVRQRQALASRDPWPDVLVMSATPIPRSLAMAVHGDLDMSTIDELPPARRPVATRVAAPSERGRVLEEVAREVDGGGQAYLVYPAIEESEKLDLLSAETAFEQLKDGPLSGCRLALLHGRVPGAERDQIMREFQAGRIDVLVATTVVEVGIDVPNAAVMVVENAERFGLSQLHQLRGRVGRGARPGRCVLVSDADTERLAVLARTSDGFEIAAEDLRLRGQGDLFGAQQHGHAVKLEFADLALHGDLLQLARDRARGVVDADPSLSKERHELLRTGLQRRFRDRAGLFGIG